MKNHFCLNILIRIWLFCIILVGFIKMDRAIAQVNPDTEWKIRKLPHFQLIYDAKHQDLADMYSVRLENAVQILSKYFTEIPDNTVVALLDRTDQPNGSATGFPFNWITLYPILPSPWETISEYGDWSQELVNHELTHVLSFAPRRGVVKALYYGFGNIITPNLLLPRWWLEGMAVEMETRTSQHGRLRSKYQDAALRAIDLANRWDEFNIATINETSIPSFPQGARPYLFGSVLWSYALSQVKYNQQSNKINDIHWRYAGRVPFLLEAPAAEILGKPYDYLFMDAIQFSISRIKNQLSLVQAKGASSFKTLLSKNVESYSASISPDGLKMAFLYKDETLKRSVKILKRKSVAENFSENSMKNVDSGKEEEGKDLNPRAPRNIKEESWDLNDGPPGGSILKISWFPDSQKILYDKSEELNRFVDASDLFVYDLKKNKADRLTTYLRAREPSVSNDGKYVAFVKIHAGKTGLSLYDLESKTETSLYDPGLEGRISHPSFYSKDEIVFSERILGTEKLKIYDLKSKSIKVILNEFNDIKLPKMTKEGLMFISSASGIPNIYLWKNNAGKAQPITNSQTAVIDFEYDAFTKELIVTSLEGEGSKLVTLSNNQWYNKELPKIEGLYSDIYSNNGLVTNEVVSEVESKSANTNTEDADYSAIGFLYPRYWIPNFSTHSEGSTFSFITSGNDPLLKHMYSIQPVYDTGSKEFSYAFSYANNSFYPLINVAAVDSHLNLPMTNQDYRQQFYSVLADFELRPLGIKWDSSLLQEMSVDLGWNWISRSFDGFRTYQTGPMLGIRYLDYSMSGEQISPESGTGAGFSVINYLPAENDQKSFYQYNADFQKYFNKIFWKLPKRHALMLRWSGQFIDQRVLVSELEPTQNYSLFSNTKEPYWVMKGYPTGAFIVKSISKYSLEYRFPISYVYRGAGTTPLFIRRLHGNVLFDAAHLDGFKQDDVNSYSRTDRWKIYRTVGIEGKADLTLAYHFPISLLAAYYWALDYKDQVNTTFYLGFQSN